MHEHPFWRWPAAALEAGQSGRCDAGSAAPCLPRGPSRVDKVGPGRRDSASSALGFDTSSKSQPSVTSPAGPPLHPER